MRLPHAWVHVPACAQNMLSHLIDADTHKYTPFCSTSANQGRRFQKARACWVKNTSLCLDAFWSWHLVPSLLIFPRDIFFTWHLFPLAFLSFDISSLGTFFCLTSLFLHASSLEIFPLTCQTHLHSNLAQQLIGQSRRRIAKYQSRTLRAHSKLSMLSCQKRMSETQQVTVHFSSVWKGIFNGKCKMSCHTRSLSSSIDATIHCAKQPWDCKTPKHQREGKRQKSLDAAVRLHRATT